jgi:hypothetical protein
VRAQRGAPQIAYLDRNGRRKLVRYWLMERLGGGSNRTARSTSSGG